MVSRQLSKSSDPRVSRHVQGGSREEAGARGRVRGRAQHGRWVRQGSTIVVSLKEEAAEALASAPEESEPSEELELALPTLRRGSKGEAVRELQRRLSAAGITLRSIDGIFGAETDAGVRRFQAARGLASDGIVGANTWAKLMSGGAPLPQPPPAATAPSWELPEAVRRRGEAQYIRYDGAPAWNGGANCSASFTPGAAELRQHILASFPGVDSIGGYACRQNTASTSETSVHGVGRALDIMIPRIGSAANAAVGDPIANWLVSNAESIGVQYVIWNRVQWSGAREGRKDRPYGGPNPHTDHIHAELTRDAAERSTPWFRARRTPA